MNGGRKPRWSGRKRSTATGSSLRTVRTDTRLFHPREWVREGVEALRNPFLRPQTNGQTKSPERVCSGLEGVRIRVVRGVWLRRAGVMKSKGKDSRRTARRLSHPKPPRGVAGTTPASPLGWRANRAADGRWSFWGMGCRGRGLPPSRHQRRIVQSKHSGRPTNRMPIGGACLLAHGRRLQA
jgi:hypothetical protein